MTRGDRRSAVAAYLLGVERLDEPTGLALARLLESRTSITTVIAVLAEAAAPPPALVALARRCTSRGLAFSIELRVPVGENLGTHDVSPVTLQDVESVSARLRGSTACAVRWVVPLSPSLVFALERLFSAARDAGADPLLLPAELLDPPAPRAASLDPDERQFAWDFITYRLLDEDRGTISSARASFYRRLAEALSRDTLPAEAALEPLPALRVEIVGAPAARSSSDSSSSFDSSFSSSSGPGPVESVIVERPRVVLEAADARDARDAGRGRSSGGARSPGAAETVTVLADGVVAAGRWTRACATARVRRRRAPLGGRELPVAVVIGAYGGEHVGDTAVLGGVLVRMARRHGVRRAIVMSQRPAHTRHLVRMLDVPVDVGVAAYEHAEIRAAVRGSDVVVFAGGPLMDLPKQLVRHLYTVSLARTAGKPFVVEGIGPGVFLRRASSWVARRLVTMASAISVRTSDDATHPLVVGLDVTVGRDPAFDYVEGRPARLTRLAERDARAVDVLTDVASERLVVGVNLRPIRHDYTVGVPANARRRHTVEVESRFEERVAEALRAVDRSMTPKPRFIFFPMNAIQFGSSDLRSAYRLQRRLSGDVDFRVWEADAGLDGIVALLRRVDVAITMRFHATVFALALGRRVVGIDYRIGRRDKGAAVLADAGRGDSCARVDEMTAGWLASRIRPTP